MKPLITSTCVISTLLTCSTAWVQIHTVRTNSTGFKQIELGDPGYGDLNTSPWLIWPDPESQASYDRGNSWDFDLSNMLQIPHIANKRTAQDVRDVCKSFDFQMTVEGFYLSGVIDWLERYTLAFQDTKIFRERGLLGSIAYEYLGDNGIKCGIGSTSLCTVACPEVVSVVNDLDEARAIFFVLKSAQHLNIVFDIIHKNLQAAQSNIGLWAPTMARVFYWASPSSYEKTYKLLLGYLNVFIQVFIGSAASFMQTSAILELAETSLALTKTQQQVYMGKLRDAVGGNTAVEAGAYLGYLNNVAAAKQDTLKSVQASVSRRKGYGGDQWYGIASPWFAVMAPQSMFDAITTYVDLEGEVAAPEKNAADLMMHIQQSTASIRVKLHRAVEFIFSGKDVDLEGATSFSKIIGAGGYLPVNDKALAKWTGSDVEEKITHKILLKAIDGAFKSQRIWISCTKDFRTTEPRKNSYSRADIPTTSCERDRSGPQDLKECVGDYVCYLYKWDARGSGYRHQVERPYGIDEMADAPYGVSVKDMIYSSVQTHLLNRANAPLPLSTDRTNLESSILASNPWDARIPGTFSIPVCISEYNWMAPVEPVFDITCDMNPQCRKKNLPCNCGIWGNETQQLWEEVGLWDAKDARDEYKKHLCPRQIERKIEDPLKKFVAYCRLGVRKTGPGGITKRTGASPLCAPIIESIESEGDPEFGTINPYLRTKLECAAGVIEKKYCKAAEALNL